MKVPLPVRVACIAGACFFILLLVALRSEPRVANPLVAALFVGIFAWFFIQDPNSHQYTLLLWFVHLLFRYALAPQIFQTAVIRAERQSLPEIEILAWIFNFVARAHDVPVSHLVARIVMTILAFVSVVFSFVPFIMRHEVYSRIPALIFLSVPFVAFSFASYGHMFSLMGGDEDIVWIMMRTLVYFGTDLLLKLTEQHSIQKIPIRPLVHFTRFAWVLFLSHWLFLVVPALFVFTYFQHKWTPIQVEYDEEPEVHPSSIEAPLEPTKSVGTGETMAPSGPPPLTPDLIDLKTSPNDLQMRNRHTAAPPAFVAPAPVKPTWEKIVVDIIPRLNEYPDNRLLDGFITFLDQMEKQSVSVLHWHPQSQSWLLYFNNQIVEMGWFINYHYAHYYNNIVKQTASSVSAYATGTGHGSNQGGTGLD